MFGLKFKACEKSENHKKMNFLFYVFSYVLCPQFSFNPYCVLNELKTCEEFSIVSTAYCQRFLQLSYIDVIYLF